MAQPKTCILSVSGPILTAGERDLIVSANPWGLILMGRSCEGPGQVRALVDSVWQAAGRAVMVFIDQEGGRVRRLKPPNWPDFPAPARFGALYERNPDLGVEAAWLGHRLIAAELEPMGVNADCAPVLDLRLPGAHAIVGDRSFGPSPDMVATLGRAALAGLAAGGVAGAIKHMPGHGRAQTDSHDAMPVVRAGRADLAEDFAPFRALREAPMGLTAHILYPALDAENPATLSSAVIEGTIRSDIGFDGLLMTDDLGMNALGGRLADRAGRALGAGCDVVLHCSGFVKSADAILEEMAEVADACPELSGRSLARAEAAQRAAGLPEPFDRREGWRRFEELMAFGPSASASASVSAPRAGA